MAKPWDHPPGKIYRPHRPKEETEERLAKREAFGKNWDSIFGKKKLNNMEDNDGKENGSGTEKAGEA